VPAIHSTISHLCRPNPIAIHLPFGQLTTRENLFALLRYSLAFLSCVFAKRNDIIRLFVAVLFEMNRKMFAWLLELMVDLDSSAGISNFVLECLQKGF